MVMWLYPKLLRARRANELMLLRLEAKEKGTQASERRIVKGWKIADSPLMGVDSGFPVPRLWHEGTKAAAGREQ